MKKISKINKLKGFTLIEILLVAGVVAVAGLVVYVAFNKAQASNRASTESSYLNLMSAGIKDLYASGTVFTGLSNTVILNAKKVPEQMIDTANPTTGIFNTFGGVVTVVPVTLGGGAANNGYQITSPGVPQSECSKLVSGLGNNFQQVTVNGAIVKTFGTNTGVDIVAAAGQCAAGGNANIMIFATT